MTVNGLDNEAVKGAGFTSKYIAFNKTGQFTLTTEPSNNLTHRYLHRSTTKRMKPVLIRSMIILLSCIFNNGTVIRRIFYFYLPGKTHFGVGNSVYVPKQFGENSTASGN